MRSGLLDREDGAVALLAAEELGRDLGDRAGAIAEVADLHQALAVEGGDLVDAAAQVGDRLLVAREREVHEIEAAHLGEGVEVVLEAAEGRDRLRKLVRRCAAEDVIAREEDVADEQADLSGAVAGGVDHAVAAADEVAVAERAIDLDGAEPVARRHVEGEHFLALRFADAGAAEEDADVTRRDDHALLEAGDHAGVELVDAEAGRRLDLEVVRAAEVIDVRVRDDGRVDRLEAHRLAEHGARDGEPEREIAARGVEAGADVEEHRVAGLEDEVDVVDVVGKRLDGEEVDRDVAAGREAPHARAPVPREVVAARGVAVRGLGERVEARRERERGVLEIEGAERALGVGGAEVLAFVSEDGLGEERALGATEEPLHLAAELGVDLDHGSAFAAAAEAIVGVLVELLAGPREGAAPARDEDGDLVRAALVFGEDARLADRRRDALAVTRKHDGEATAARHRDAVDLDGGGRLGRRVDARGGEPQHVAARPREGHDDLRGGAFGREEDRRDDLVAFPRDEAAREPALLVIRDDDVAEREGERLEGALRICLGSCGGSIAVALAAVALGGASLAVVALAAVLAGTGVALAGVPVVARFLVVFVAGAAAVAEAGGAAARGEEEAAAGRRAERADSDGGEEEAHEAPPEMAAAKARARSRTASRRRAPSPGGTSAPITATASQSAPICAAVSSVTPPIATTGRPGARSRTSFTRAASSTGPTTGDASFLLCVPKTGPIAT